MGGQQHHTPAYDRNKNRTWATLRKLWHRIGAVGSTGSEERDCFCLRVDKLEQDAALVSRITISNLSPLSHPSSSRPLHNSSLSPFSSMTTPHCFCLFVFDKPSSLYPLTLPPSAHLPQACSVSIFHLSVCRSVQVGACVVLSFSGFTHSRYYHQTPVSIADSHLDRAVNHLADNDGRCPLCQAWCPQMKACARHGLNRIIHISCWTIR